ncbi:MAG TPA: Hsp20/alpha crystallin family protein [Gemmatimonadales bacterium]|nr:Hsp20/alpha crystallin family protein [Gemmatimonadales bacterium]
MYLTTRSLAPDQAGDFATTLGSRINRMLSDVFSGTDWAYPVSATAAWVPPVDVLEQADAIRIMAELPGVKPEDVKISVEGNVLTLHGMKQQVAEERTERVHRYERTYGAFERSFTLPATVDTQHINANYDNGVLTITLPKAEQAKPRQIAVQVAKQS